MDYKWPWISNCGQQSMDTTNGWKLPVIFWTLKILVNWCTRFFQSWLHGEFQPRLKFRSAHRAEVLLQLHAQFQRGRKRKIPWESLLRCENTVDAHARVSFSALHEKVRLAGLKILARFENTGLGFLARAELRPGLSPSPCNRQFDFKRICFRSRAEIRHVIRPVYAVDIW